MGEINFPLIVSALVFGGAAAALFCISRRKSLSLTLPVTADWIEELSIERYRPMLRLLENEDLVFLRAQPGYEARHEAMFRAQRVALFKEYLRCLQSDFRRMSSAIRLFMVQSRDDRPDLARTLIRRQVLFAASMAVIHVRLVLYRSGVCGVDASGPIRSFEALRLQLRGLLPESASLRA